MALLLNIGRKSLHMSMANIVKVNIPPINTSTKLVIGCCRGKHTLGFRQPWLKNYFTRKWTLIAFTIGSGLCISFYSHKYNVVDSWSPSVYASVKNPRTQFDIADVVEKATPSVVCIEIRGRHPYSGHSTSVSSGSGFIVRENGLILTNAHVVHNKRTVIVKLHDGREFEGIVTTVEPVGDLATIKINAGKLPFLPLGRSSAMRPGEWVIAMGSPLSLSNTVTAGIVSSTHRDSRELGIHNKDMQYIQTDATITSGNSGGPLVNLNGEVIGINTMKVTPGISFAIPSDYASTFLLKAEELMKRAKNKSGGFFGTGDSNKKRRYMGIVMLSLTPNILLELKERGAITPDLNGGVFVHIVTIGSPAHKGGIHTGDVITQINGKEVKSSSDVYAAVDKSNVLQVQVMRGDEKIMLKITSEEVD